MLLRKKSRSVVFKYPLVLLTAACFFIGVPGFSSENKETLKWEDLSKVKNVTKPPASIAKLKGQTVAIAGFMVPLDGDHRGSTEFLLVPFQGQCFHIPPPPPNQMIHVKMVKGRKKYTWEPVLVKGRFSIFRAKNEFGDSFFAIDARRVTIYE